MSHLTGITQFRQKTYAMYNTLSSYANSHNQDCGADSKERSFYKQVKYKRPFAFASKPAKITQSDKTMRKSAHSFVESFAVQPRLSPVNKPLEFSVDRFKATTIYDAKNPVTAKISTSNISWIKQEANKMQMNKIKQGEYIPSLAHLDVYGRRKEPSKFEQYGLWISRSPFNL